LRVFGEGLLLFRYGRLIDQQGQSEAAARGGLGVDGAEVGLDRAIRNSQLLGDLQVRQPLSHQSGDLVFPVGKAA